MCYFIVLSLISLVGCQKYVDFNKLPAFTDNGHVNCIIEIPAGTSKKIEFNKKTNTFEIDQRDGKDRIIGFLPYPGNYGYVAGTYSDPKKGGDGDSIDMLIIAESLPSETVIEAIPIAVFKLIDAGEEDFKIIGIPAATSQQIIAPKSFADLKNKYPKVLEIIETWFLHYDPSDTLFSKGWGDEKEAREEIQKALSTPH